MLPERKIIPHSVPSWVDDAAVYFVTICANSRGQNSLCRDSIAKDLWLAFQFYQEQGNWWPHLVLLMPDHLHGLISFNRSVSMKTMISRWKRYTAKKLTISWQRDFFDHRLRRDESYVEKAHYIRMNPVRAGLVERMEDWPYVWELNRFGRALSPKAPLI